MARYDGIADWYDIEFLSETHDPGRKAAVRLLGPGPGRLLDLGCGTGAQTVAFRESAADFRIECFEEGGEDDYPYMVALRARR